RPRRPDRRRARGAFPGLVVSVVAARLHPSISERRTALLAIVVTAALGLAASGAGVVRLDGSRIATSEVDATVERLMRAANVTGAAVAIFNDRRPVHVKAYGVRDADLHAPLTIDPVMAAASFTKVAFAYMVLQLVDEGVI